MANPAQFIGSNVTPWVPKVDPGLIASESFNAAFETFFNNKLKKDQLELQRKKIDNDISTSDRLLPLQLENQALEKRKLGLDISLAEKQLKEEDDLINRGGIQGNAGNYMQYIPGGPKPATAVTPQDLDRADDDLPLPSGRAPASIRYNNPGAQYPGPSAKKFGSTGTETIGGGHKIAVFEKPEDGAAAQFDLLDRAYTGKTLKDAVSKWSGGNSVGTYLDVIKGRTGLSEGDVITKEMLRNPDVAIPLARSMARQEAGRDYPLDDTGWRTAHSMAFGT